MDKSTMDLPKSYLSQEQKDKSLANGGTQNLIYIMEASAANKVGDQESFWRWLALTDVPLCSLTFIKSTHGIEHLLKYNFDLTPAIEAFGPEWLESDKEDS